MLEEIPTTIGHVIEGLSQHIQQLLDVKQTLVESRDPVPMDLDLQPPGPDPKLHAQSLRAQEKARNYNTNPRNTEHHWDTAYVKDAEKWLTTCTTILVETQQDLFTRTNPAHNPGSSLKASVTAPQGSSQIVRPDVLITHLNNVRSHLFELKKAITRKSTSPMGFPLNNQAKAAIVNSLNRAMDQVTCQGLVYFKSLRKGERPDEIMLLAAAGPWFSYRLMHYSESISVAKPVEDLADLAYGGRDEDAEDDPPALSSVGASEGLREGTFQLDETTGQFRRGWSPPFLLGSQRGEDEMRHLMSFAVAVEEYMLRYISLYSFQVSSEA
ncbi:hypothetical protein D9758_005311 [Tetrapyrgos nigripes]|uniref:Uncharacterized protein n=1 Tax=Tetrapyrgos nigripes TaxID=182062 RepID=A0A8H5GWI6_9AGAR|nr:hypothetical protein D9758_005311 [Tetrapyrgos nigripes]